MEGEEKMISEKSATRILPLKLVREIFTKSKLSQLKIQQTAFMLLAVTLFFALVGLLVLGFRLSDIKSSANLLEEENAVLLASKLANSPELSCGESFGTEKISCVDADKIMNLKTYISKYSDFWGVSNIEIRKIYPKSSADKLCTMSNYPDCNIIRLISNQVIGKSASTFVSLCRKESMEGSQDYYDKCEIAKLIISYEDV